MAKFAARPTITMNITLSLTEEEARALEALGGYGADAFIKTFYEFLGRNYMEPHERGLRSLLATVRPELLGILEKLDNAQREFNAPSRPQAGKEEKGQ